MTTSTLERPVTRTATFGSGRPAESWTCDNCRTETSAVRKRCSDCGTSRY
jgi:formate dehydrogenase maturation protein FdhE